MIEIREGRNVEACRGVDGVDGDSREHRVGETVAAGEKEGQTRQGKENMKRHESEDEVMQRGTAGTSAEGGGGDSGDRARRKSGQQPQQQQQRPGTAGRATAAATAASFAAKAPPPLPPSEHQPLAGGGGGNTSQRPYSRLYQYCSSRDTPPLSARNRVCTQR